MKKYTVKLTTEDTVEENTYPSYSEASQAFHTLADTMRSENCKIENIMRYGHKVYTIEIFKYVDGEGICTERIVADGRYCPTYSFDPDYVHAPWSPLAGQEVC